VTAGLGGGGGAGSRIESAFRQFTPLLLLLLLLVVVAEPWLPGTAWLRQQFGDHALLRAAVAVLVCYVLVLWGETLRLHGVLTGVLQAFRTFQQQEGGGGKAANPKARLEAARLLIAALRSDDPSIVATSRHNLSRLVGQDLGADPAVWQRWLDQQPTP
jgi:Ca2+/H+ antiporter